MLKISNNLFGQKVSRTNVNFQKKSIVNCSRYKYWIVGQLMQALTENFDQVTFSIINNEGKRKAVKPEKLINDELHYFPTGTFLQVITNKNRKYPEYPNDPKPIGMVSAIMAMRGSRLKKLFGDKEQQSPLIIPKSV